MALVLEDGTGVAGANTYALEADADAYFEARGNTTWTDSTDDKEGALVRATAAIEAKYGSRYPGSRANGRSQPLGWPRTSATDADDEEIADDEIPQELIDAVCEASLRELIEPGSMMPDLDRGGAINRLKAGSVEVEYSGNASATTTYTLIDGILARLLGAAQASFIGTAVRG